MGSLHRHASNPTPVLTPEELQAQADSFGWFHSIALGRGARTKGLSELAFGTDQLPDFAGKTVFDIGAWDGYYSFLAERQGASRVVAVDHYAWGVDFGARGGYWYDRLPNGPLPARPLAGPGCCRAPGPPRPARFRFPRLAPRLEGGADTGRLRHHGPRRAR